MSLRAAATTAKAVSAITWAVESTGRLVGKGGRAFYTAVKHKDYYHVSIMEPSSGEVIDQKEMQTMDDVKGILNSLKHFKGMQLIIKQDS
tara:strand:+ start:734 stop:1003 length:270 start_codon:yes stop_codon:yes gene_type:complete